VKSKSSEYDLDELAIDLDSVYSVTTNCALSLPSKGLGCVNGSLGLLYIKLWDDEREHVGYPIVRLPINNDRYIVYFTFRHAWLD
jgi:hypothetical protein